MRISALLIFLLVATMAFSFGLIWIGCGDDDDDDASSSDDDDDDPAQGEPGKLNGCVLDFQTRQPVQSALVELLDNATGDPLTDADGNAITATSPGGDGCITLDGIPAENEFVGVKVSRADHKDTYQFYFENGLENEEFLIVSEATASLVSASLNLTIQPDRGFAAGGLYWGDALDENAIGCSIIEFDTPPDDGIYYFGIDELPTAGRAVTGDVPTNGQGTNPCCNDDPKSFFVGMNQPLGSVTISAKVPCTAGDDNCVEDGDGNYWFTESTYLPMVAPNSVCIVDVYLPKTKYAKNPNPDFCED